MWVAYLQNTYVYGIKIQLLLDWTDVVARITSSALWGPSHGLGT